MPEPLAIESTISRGRSAAAADWSLEVNKKIEVKNQEEEKEEEDVLIRGTERPWPSRREEAWESDCKTDQNAITTCCFECLFMSRLRGLADLLPAKCNRYINKRQESSANGSPNWEATSCHEVILLGAEIAPSRRRHPGKQSAARALRMI